MNTKLHHVEDWSALAREADWSVAKLAQLCGVSARTLERYFIKSMAERPKSWLAKQRQSEAINFLKNGSTVKETAGRLKYKHPSHLTNEFKKHWGVPPTSPTALMPKRKQ